jgi:lipopolysaccharide transport system ATP-binding protein
MRDILARALHRPFSRNGTRDSERFIWALRDISLDVYEGEVVGLIGRNGAGKTTLLKILSRITRPTEGYAEIRGRVGSLLEVGTGFHPELTGFENIYLSGAILGMRRREIAKKLDAIIAFAEVERHITSPLKFYSTGMQVRLAFAVAAHLEPEILLVDEVLAVGDLEFQRKCLGKMQEVSRSGRTIIFVSHQMGQMRRLCERVIWIDKGQIREQGRAGEIIGSYESACLQPQIDAVQGDNCFLAWSISGDGNAVRDETTEISIQFKLQLREAISQGHFGVAILNESNMVVTGWGFDNIDIPAGVQEVAVRLPSLPLKPGGYSLSCSIYDRGNNLNGGRLVEQWSALPPLIIDTKPVGHPQDRWAGMLNIQGIFRVLSKS